MHFLSQDRPLVLARSVLARRALENRVYLVYVYEKRGVAGAERASMGSNKDLLVDRRHFERGRGRIRLFLLV